ncbi:MAG: MaoC family dehydratase N-terminal domain-containing protein [Pseudomonadota bacterium]
MANWNDWIGRTQAQTDVLTPALLTRFRATIDSNEVGDVAPQGIHWCLCVPDAATSELGEDGHPRKGGFLPPILLPRRMWASSTVGFHAPISAGDVITRESSIASISEKTGGSGPLIFVGIDHQTHANGRMAVTEHQTLVYREATSAAPTERPADCAPDLSQWQWSRNLAPTEPQLFRYSALTFNSHRIHYDRPYAVEEEHYRGLVVHGPLTATLLLAIAAQALGANMLKHFAFRGQSPAFAGEPLHLVGKANEGAITLAALGGDGRIVMSAEAGL